MNLSKIPAGAIIMISIFKICAIIKMQNEKKIRSTGEKEGVINGRNMRRSCSSGR